jgi:sec-independent protein translocase protein TatB
MFDIGFSEILLIAIVALLVVGPRELPGLVRNLGRWVGGARRMMNTLKSDFEREIHKADEIQRLMSKEVEILETHKSLDQKRQASTAVNTIPLTTDDKTASTASVSKPDHGSTPS